MMSYKNPSNFSTMCSRSLWPLSCHVWSSLPSLDRIRFPKPDSDSRSSSALSVFSNTSLRSMNSRRLPLMIEW